MDKKIDFSLYNQARARFSTLEKGMIVLISLCSDKVEELIGQIFIEETELEEYYELMLEHKSNDRPYVVLSWDDENVASFFFRCREFVREEYLITGKTIQFRLDPFKRINPTSADVQADFADLAKLLHGNSQAS